MDWIVVVDGCPPAQNWRRGITTAKGARVCTQLVDEITKPDSVMALPALQEAGRRRAMAGSPCKLHLRCVSLMGNLGV